LFWYAPLICSKCCNIFDTDLLSGMIHCEEKKIIKYKSEKKCAYCKNGLIYDNLCLTLLIVDNIKNTNYHKLGHFYSMHTFFHFCILWFFSLHNGSYHLISRYQKYCSTCYIWGGHIKTILRSCTAKLKLFIGLLIHNEPLCFCLL
jgi:hypothetical protein